MNTLVQIVTGVREAFGWAQCFGLRVSPVVYVVAVAAVTHVAGALILWGLK